MCCLNQWKLARLLRGPVCDYIRKCFKKSFMFDGAHIRNSLPTGIRESNSIMPFEKKSLYSHFLIALLMRFDEYRSFA
jgi:hypothetical protein